MAENTKPDEQADTKFDELVTPEEHTKVAADAVVKTASTDPESAGIADVSDEGVSDDIEVGARSADMEDASTEHVKVFVLGPSPINGVKGNPYTEARGFDHEPNKTATRQYMIDQGLWPRGDVRFISGKKHPDGESWILSYGVEAIPASDAVEGRTHPEVVGYARADGDDVVVNKPLNYEDAEPERNERNEPTA